MDAQKRFNVLVVLSLLFLTLAILVLSAGLIVYLNSQMALNKGITKVTGEVIDNQSGILKIMEDHLKFQHGIE